MIQTIEPSDAYPAKLSGNAEAQEPAGKRRGPRLKLSKEDDGRVTLHLDGVIAEYSRKSTLRFEAGSDPSARPTICVTVAQ